MPRALVVDDEAVSRLVVGRMLESLGFEVTLVPDVPEACELLAAESFDLVISDYLMPSGTGLQLARRIADTKPTPFILVTGVRYETDLGIDATNGIDVHLTKPVSSTELAQAVASLADCLQPAAAPDEPLHDDLTRSMMLLEAIGVEVTLVDSNAAVITSTAASRQTLGYDEQFWSQVNLFDLAHPDDLILAQTALAEMLGQPGGSKTARFRAHHRDGHWEVVEIHCTNLLEDPRVGALVMTTRAVTAEEQLRVANQKAQERQAVQGEYVANVSHELRSPLQGILGVSQLLEDLVSGEAAELVNIIHTEATRLRHVIDDILDYAKVERGAMELAPNPTSVRQVVSDVVGIASAQVRETVVIRVEIDDAVGPWVMVDELRLHQILLNLTANSARLTRVGSIAISCRVLEGERLHFAVADTGPGIRPDQIDRLLEPFQQGRPSESNEGTGLGLTISDKLIRLMGGRLDVESQVGIGAQFSFALHAPAASAPDQRGQTGVFAERVDALQAIRALVIDDNEVNRLVIRRQLETMGLQVDVADGGMLGAEMANADTYQLVVSDWHMPDVDGLEAIRRIRVHDADVHRHTPIVVMTASAMADDRQKCLTAGADDFLAKPAAKSELQRVALSLIEAHYSMSAPQDPSENQLVSSVTVTEADAGIAAILEELAVQLADRAVVATVVGTFTSELAMRVNAIRQAIIDGDGPSAGQSAHTLKSPSMMLGAVELGRFCERLETQHEASTADIAELERLAGEAAASFRRWAEQQKEPSR